VPATAFITQLPVDEGPVADIFIPNGKIVWLEDNRFVPVK